MTPHRISWVHYPGGPVSGRVTCSAPHGAPCRRYCHICPSDMGDFPHEHEWGHTNGCLFANWVNGERSAVESYDGDPDMPVRDGFIVGEWHPEYEDYRWRYAPEIESR